MPILTVKLGERERRISFDRAGSLREILDATDVRVRAGCRGSGSCGLCRVRIEDGYAGVPTRNERIILGDGGLRQDIRLACQVMPEKDLSITILAPAPRSNWRSLPEGAEERKKRSGLDLQEIHPEVRTPYGVAVDLGTTHIRISLFELSSGKWVAGRYGPNPQLLYGSDVMTRLIAASEAPEQALALSRQAVGAVGDALLDMTAREGIDIAQVVRLSLVGNTTMLALLSGRNHSLLLRPDHWASAIDCLPGNGADLAISLGIHPRARIDILPPLAGFVGSDLLAGVLTTRLTENGAGSLLVDFGTNSEIALWDGKTLWVTSAAGGPAFEESGVACGAPAEPGAIHRVCERDGAFHYEVIAGGDPHGVCGSGMVDLIACLVRSGRLSAAGRFTPALSGEGLTIVRGEADIVIRKRDVDLFQRAKGAIGAGMEILMKNAGMGIGDLRRLCIGGLFGRYLDIGNARDIGLLPAISPDLVELCGSTALAGCEDTLFEPAAVERLMAIRERSRLVDMSGCPDFDEIYLKNLYLRPMSGG